MQSVSFLAVCVISSFFESFSEAIFRSSSSSFLSIFFKDVAIFLACASVDLREFTKTKVCPPFAIGSHANAIRSWICDSFVSPLSK